MKISVIAVGKARDPLRAAILEYEKRASHYWKLEVVEVDPGARRKSATQSPRGP